MNELDFDELRRWPDFESPELRAWDAADTLILDEAVALPGAAIADADVVVIGDEYGALTLGALDRGAASVRVHQDRLSGELALRANGAAAGEASWVSMPLAKELITGATLVLLRLPRSLDALDEIAALVAEYAAPGVVVVAGGRIKHMTVTMNEVLRRHFGRVDVTHARQKSRALIARDPLAGTPVEPRRKLHADVGLWVVATGGVFAGTSIDIGTRALLGVLDRVAPFESAVDLGSGTGILAAALARQNTSARVLATDESAAAVASATLTMQANGLDVTVTQDDAASTVPDRSVDLVVLNPPFHTGAAVHSGVSTKLFEAASRILRPGGELWTVYNSHLDYKPTLERISAARPARWNAPRSSPSPSLGNVERYRRKRQKGFTVTEPTNVYQTVPRTVAIRRPALLPKQVAGARLAGIIGFLMLSLGFWMFSVPLAIFAVVAFVGLIFRAIGRTSGNSDGYRQVVEFVDRLHPELWIVPLVIIAVVGLAIMVVALFVSTRILRSHDVARPWPVTWAGTGIAIVASWIVSGVLSVPLQIVSIGGDNDNGLPIRVLIGILGFVVSIVATAAVGWLAWWWAAHLLRAHAVAGVTAAQTVGADIRPQDSSSKASE